MSDGGKLDAWINPLRFLEVDGPASAKPEEEISAEDVLEFLCATDIEATPSNLVSRYKKITENTPDIFAAPNEQRILDKLIWPLRHAKAGYMTGNYLGTIALCGMVAEMLAILISDLSVLRINKTLMTAEQQKALFGSTFEKLPQERRVAVLRVYGTIEDNMKHDFDLIRVTRRKYLHLWSQDHDSLPSDAIACYGSALRLMAKTLGLSFRRGKVLVPPALIEYLQKTGTLRTESSADEE